MKTEKVGGVDPTTTPTKLKLTQQLFSHEGEETEMEREGMRRLMGLYATGGGARLPRACILRSQSRVTSTEAVGQESPSGLLLERHASSSSWSSADRSPVTKELRSPGFLRRALPDSLANGENIPSSQQQRTALPRYFVDTQAMVRALEDGGYSREQAESVVSLISTALAASLEPVLSSQITRRDLDLLAVQFSGEVDSIRSGVVLLERSTIDSLRSENEGLRAQIRKLHENLKEEMKKLESGLQLDMNLEKGRLREEATNLSQRIKDTHNRIETEVAQLKTQIESQKLESIKYLAGGIFSVVTIVLSVMLGLSRLLK